MVKRKRFEGYAADGRKIEISVMPQMLIHRAADSVRGSCSFRGNRTWEENDTTWNVSKYFLAGGYGFPGSEFSIFTNEGRVVRIVTKTPLSLRYEPLEVILVTERLYDTVKQDYDGQMVSSREAYK
jgi:hypothetical protein